MQVAQERQIYVNRPGGVILPDHTKLLDQRIGVGMRAEPKIGCVDNGQGTREDRVILVFEDAEGKDSQWPNINTSMHGIFNGLVCTAYNRKSEPYKVRPIPYTVLSQLTPLLRSGFRVFDCGFFPHGKRACDLVIYGLPSATNDPDMLTYAEMREHLELHYPVYLDKRVIYQFEVLKTKYYEAYERQLHPDDPVHLRDYTDGTLNSLHLSDHIWEKAREDPYWYDLNDKVDCGPQVYILPSFPVAPYLETLWDAIKQCPETTYEGFVFKYENMPEKYTDRQQDNRHWRKFRCR
jgi:hypothetical protein